MLCTPPNKKLKLIWYFTHLLDKILTLGKINPFICPRLIEFFVPLQAEMAIWRQKPPDVRECGESPQLFLQL